MKSMSPLPTYRHPRLVLLILVLIACMIGGCNSESSSAPISTSTTGAGLTNQSTSISISSNGVLLPARRFSLSFSTGGLIQSLYVDLGEQVKAGDTLVSLDTTEAKFAVQMAESDLTVAQTEYDLSLSNIAASQQDAALELIQAQQAFNELYEDASLVKSAALRELADASRTLENARYQLYNFTITAIFADLDPLEALSLARDNLDHARSEFDPYKKAPSSDSNRLILKQNLDRATSEYNSALKWVELQAAQDEAEARLEIARLDLERLENGPDPDKVALAEARLANAQAQLSHLFPEDGITEQVTLAKARVDSARFKLEIAQTRLEGLTLKAPHDGVISAIKIQEGEWAASSASIIELLDTSKWLVETKNVGELQIGQVSIGQKVRIRFNAFQDETLSGQVIAISPDAIVQQGDITYSLIIALEPTKLNLRPGMTSRVEILIED